MFGVIGTFIVKSFHIFLVLLILVGWAVLPRDELIPLIITMGAIPILWNVFDGNCVLTMLEEELSGEKNNSGFVNDMVEPIGLSMDKRQMDGVLLLILATSGFLAARRLLARS